MMWNKEVWDRHLWTDKYDWAKNVMVSVWHVNAYQKALTVEKELRGQVDKIFQPVDVIQPLSLAMALWAHEQSDHGSRDGYYTWAQDLIQSYLIISAA